MTINVCYNESEETKLDKTITALFEKTGVLRDGTSILDPVIRVNGSVDDYATANYLEIPSFGRSYFITDIKAVLNNIVEISAHVDVLSTYKSQLRSLNAIVKRSEKHYNLYLNDGSIKAYQNPYVYINNFPNGLTDEEFVLVVAGS